MNLLKRIMGVGLLTFWSFASFANYYNTYIVIDLSQGPTAERYPISYLSEEPAGGWTDEYKLTKLVLRRIEPGTFVMGNSRDTWEYNDSQQLHNVTLTKAYYIGVFEVTQKQWELVMGSNPSYFNAAIDSGKRPVETISYNVIRGSVKGGLWPSSSSVDETSFIARLRAKTSLNAIDLPTSAQWEYACRAGTTTALYNGKDLKSATDASNVDTIGWYDGNSSGETHEVGSLAPNAWGLYDMYGNVWEWCLDWTIETTTSDSVVDPVGPTTPTETENPARIIRGGSYEFGAQGCSSGRLDCYACYRISHHGGDFGMRLCFTEKSTKDGLVAWYKFDGDANDLSGNRNDGVVHGAVLTTDRFGRADSAYSFDGDDWIAVPHSTSLADWSNGLTISVWLKPQEWYASSFGKWIPIVCKADYGYREGTFRCQIGEADGGSSYQLRGEVVGTGDDAITLGEWQMVSMVCDGERLSVYKNGNLVGTAPADSITSQDDMLEIGRDIVGGTEYMKGCMDDLRIYNRALTASEVSSIYNEGSDPITYRTVTFNANGGTCAMSSTKIEDDTQIGTLPTATRDGYEFLGWFTAAEGGTQVTAVTVVTADVTWYAQWQEKVVEPVVPPVDPNDDDEPMDASIANTYDGVIVDADGLPMGYINVKTSKATGKDDTKVSKVTATIQMVGEAKKVTIKANVSTSTATMMQAAADGRVLDLTFSRNGIWGTFDGYEVDGVRNLLASTAKSDKGTDAMNMATAAYTALKGNYTMAFEDENGWNGLSISVMAKGKVKVSGKLANGVSVATTSQLIVGVDYSVIPVIYTKKDTSLAFNIYFPNEGGEAEVFGYYDAVIAPVSGLDGGATFNVSDAIFDLFEDYSVLDEFLPYGISVEPNGTKWIVANGAKAGSIKMVDGDVVDKKESDNPSGLKLTFTAKTGIFKGSFKVYALDANDKLKSFSATVNGIVVGGYGYGSATIKKYGSCAVTIGQ